MSFIVGRSLLVASIGLLSACAGAPTATRAPSTVTPVQQTAVVAALPTASAAPQARLEQTTAPTALPATAIATATDLPAPTLAPTQPALTVRSLAASQYQGLPQGVTLDGFPFLGQPDAPITLIDYSDFL